MKRYAALTLGLLILASSSGCCGCLGALFGMPGGYGGGGCCQPCGGGAYGAGMQSSPCGPGGCGGAYAPSSVSPTALAPGGYQQASVPYPYQTSALNMNPLF